MVVKMFMKDGRPLTGQDFLTKQFKMATRECQIARDLQIYAEGDRSGANRFMKCFEDHTDRKAGPLYVVLEYCGDQSLTMWLEEHHQHDTLSNALVNSVWSQLQEGLEYMVSYKRQWVHHDLKDANIVIDTRNKSDPQLKIIDFGTVTAVTESTEQPFRELLPATPAYAPPESSHQGFDCPWHSFDAYSAATIYVVMLVGVSPTQMNLWDHLEEWCLGVLFGIEPTLAPLDLETMLRGALRRSRKGRPLSDADSRNAAAIMQAQFPRRTQLIKGLFDKEKQDFLKLLQASLGKDPIARPRPKNWRGFFRPEEMEALGLRSGEPDEAPEPLVCAARARRGPADPRSQTAPTSQTAFGLAIAIASAQVLLAGQ